MQRNVGRVLIRFAFGRYSPRRSLLTALTLLNRINRQRLPSRVLLGTDDEWIIRRVPSRRSRGFTHFLRASRRQGRFSPRARFMRPHAASSGIFRGPCAFSDVNWNVSFILLPSAAKNADCRRNLRGTESRRELNSRNEFPRNEERETVGALYARAHTHTQDVIRDAIARALYIEMSKRCDSFSLSFQNSWFRCDEQKPK